MEKQYTIVGVKKYGTVNRKKNQKTERERKRSIHIVRGKKGKKKTKD